MPAAGVTDFYMTYDAIRRLIKGSKSSLPESLPWTTLETLTLCGTIADRAGGSVTYGALILTRA